MKIFFSSLYLFLAVIAGVLIFSLPLQKNEKVQDKTPNDWFFLQRAFPYPEINYTAREAAWEQAQALRSQYAERGEGWVLKGPYNIGGRISALAMHPSDMQTIYAGAASGGIFKSTDAGSSWDPVFDDALSLSIGDIAIAPSDPDIVWVGTGEANAGGGSMTYDGFGIYKSDDGGASWEQVGLENSGSIGRLAVSPDDPQSCYAAAMGRLFSNNPERGVFRTTDGGANWEKVLFVNDSVGAIDIIMHPLHPDTLYAAMWERVRTPDRRNYGGTGCGIYRSYNGGDTWQELTNGLPTNSPSNGRIGIDISQSDPDILYAIYADNIGYFDGVYKSLDGGDSWFRTNDSYLDNMYSSYGWWFGRISIDPSDPDVAYAIGFDLYKTTNGGNSWSLISNYVHVDHHDLLAHPLNPDFVVDGNDGGVYLSYNGGSSWTFVDNLPITQFYTCDADEQHPERLYGGTQDNGTNRTYTGGESDWENIYYGDGFYVLVDPTDDNYIYAEYQYGNFARSTNGGLYFSTAMNGISSSDRKNWNTPFVIDPVVTDILYYGANRLYRSGNRAESWQVISSDLTNGGNGSGAYGTITTIGVSFSDNQCLYVGTDDGNVWCSKNYGATWQNISAGLPLRWVTRVVSDWELPYTVYVTLSGYRYDSYQPHVFRSTDYGENWQDISGNLPEAPANDIVIDLFLDSTLYLATDFGVFVTRDMGQNWAMLGDNLPNVPIVDLRYVFPGRFLVAATYGRSMYTFDLDQLVGVQKNNISQSDFSIYPNPAKDHIIINYPFRKGNISYRIMDEQGKTVCGGSLISASEKVSLSGLPDGMYIVNLYLPEEKVISQKLIIHN